MQTEICFGEPSRRNEEFVATDLCLRVYHHHISARWTSPSTQKNSFTTKRYVPLLCPREFLKCAFFQQQGSLCAVHCLNNLLQGNYFTAVDLGKFADDLDEAERIKMAEGGQNSEEYRKFIQVLSIFLSVILISFIQIAGPFTK